MKKVLIVLLIILIAAGGFVFLGLSGLDDLIKQQIETQGSKVTKTSVTVSKVETKLTEAKITIGGLGIANPEGYSVDDAFKLNTVRLDLGTSTSEPYVIEEILIDAPEVLYELGSAGKANLITLKENLQASLPQSETSEPTGEAANPLVSVKKIKVQAVKLKLNLQALDLEQLPDDKRQFELTLPTFYADAVGVPDGIPADQVGAAIVDAMLDNLIKEGKRKVKGIFEDEAKQKLEEEKQKLEEKAKEKLKGLLGG
ncbi:hypothetical protein [Planctobacterium marinum]|uniref:AsmA domain-containing protein n=1 Tax=Planctobacterium marinum TaxID=1631968 RepID=A0AA48HU09_9ALTE|nr:hypothetical protein MACH26_13540 [Planctobacterium marinum]